jgi:hypothetical protein
MPVVNGFFENGAFVPDKPLADIKGRQRAVLNIDEMDCEGRQARIDAWREFSRAVRASDDFLGGNLKKFVSGIQKKLKFHEMRCNY